MNLRRILAICTLVTLSFSSVTAIHVPSVEAQERDVEKAKEAFREGRDFYANEEYEKAADLFLEAHEYSGRSELYYNIGQAYRNAGKLVEAEKYFQLYLADMPDAPNSEDVVNLIIEIQQQIAASLATVQIEASPATSAMVYVDDEAESRCSTPCEIQIEAGRHTVRIRNDRGQEASQSISVEASQKLSLDLVFKSIGKLMLISDVPGQVRVGDQVDTRLPLDSPLELAPGTYPVSIISEDVSWNGDVEVVADETVQVMVPMQGMDQGGGTSVLQAVSYGLWGLGGALVIGGAVMGMQAQDTFDNLESQRASGFGIDPAIIEQGRSQQSTANTLYIAGGLSIGAGIGLYVWDALSDDEPESAPSAVSENEVRAAEEDARESSSAESSAVSESPDAEESDSAEEDDEEDVTLDLLE